jgi:hypothetical protein
VHKLALTTRSPRVHATPGCVTRQRRSDAEKFSAQLAAKPEQYLRDEQWSIVKPTGVCDAAIQPRLPTLEPLVLRIVNGPLAGLTLNVRAEAGGVTMRVEAPSTTLYARVMRVHQQLEAELTQSISLEWHRAPDSH